MTSDCRCRLCRILTCVHWWASDVWVYGVLSVGGCEALGGGRAAIDHVEPGTPWLGGLDRVKFSSLTHLIAICPADFRLPLLLRCLQVSDALAAAEPYKEQLQRRGVFVVPLPVYGGDAGAAMPSAGREELRWRAQPLQPAAWREWFGAQLALAPNATLERGLYVGLRLDGRVRASGMGQPPWARFAVELAPLEGERAGLLG
eukprot:GHRQ01023360.1.p1 GENE.GHRQ01023360.1~~GHRQ01023360.1.p1  ORF type:complete len:202 (+),score=42.16 GHRQ01023360.1:71-676(+)